MPRSSPGGGGGWAQVELTDALPLVITNKLKLTVEKGTIKSVSKGSHGGWSRAFWRHGSEATFAKVFLHLFGYFSQDVFGKQRWGFLRRRKKYKITVSYCLI